MNNKHYRLIVFDWEGTLADTLGLILHCIASEAKRLHYGILDLQMARQMVEFGLTNALRKIFPDLSLEQQEGLLLAVQQTLISKHHEVFLMPGVRECIPQLKEAGFLLAIASNKNSSSLQKAVDNAGIASYFDCICGASDFPSKPDKAMLDYILSDLGVAPDEAVVVGDSITDIQMAVNGCVDGIGIDFYKHQGKLLKTSGAVKIFHDYDALFQYLLHHEEEAPS